MRITLATRIYAPEPAAAAFRLEHLVRALASDADIDVVTVMAPGGHRPHSRASISRWPVLRDSAGYVRGYLPYLSFDLPLVLRLLFRRRPDVYVVEPPPTTGAVVRLIAMLRRRPYVWYAADIWSDAAASTGSPAVVVRALRALESWVLRGAAASLAVSDGVAARVCELGGREAVVVGNGVDIDVFTPRGDRLADARTFVYAGTASEWQGADIFARAMAQVVAEVPDARLVFLGQGSGMAEIERFAMGLPAGTIRVLGSVSAPESAAWLRGAAAAVVSIVPDQGYDLAIPTKVFAALAAGTFVLYAGAGPVVDILADERLGTAVHYDVDSVAESMVARLHAIDTESADEVHAYRSGWVAEHRSLGAVARRAAHAVLARAR